MASEKIGRYEILGEIGRGGMATVFRAHDPLFERTVAVKVLPQQMLHEPEFRVRFVREAKTIATLEHPAIVPVYDFGEEDDQPYLVMRYMPGGSLAERLQAGPIDMQETAVIMHRLASALDAAHKQGIVHRDLKPGNILFDQYGEAYLADFGIVRLTQSSAALTASGGVLGTPAYMSPEQVYGDKELDGRSDIYALGVILFQMLTGHVPYEADTPAKMMMAHVMDPVPQVLEKRPDLPYACENVIQKAMAKERDQRFSTARDLSDALQHITASQPVLSSAPLSATVPSPPAAATDMAAAEPVSTNPAPDLPAASKTRLPFWVWLVIGFGLLGLLCVGAVGLWVGQTSRHIQVTAAAVSALLTREAQQIAATNTAVAETVAASETSAALAAQATATAQGEMAITETAVAKSHIAATAAATRATVVATTATPIPATSTPIPATSTPIPAQQGSIPPLYGPTNGELRHELDDLIESAYADVSIQDFMVQAVVGTPFTSKQGRWDIGITFRQARSNEELRLVIRSDGVWNLNDRRTTGDNFIQEGNLSAYLDLTSDGHNELVLIVQGETGYFLLNGNFVAQLDLSSRVNAGDVALSTGFYTVDEQEGAVTTYQDFTLWPINVMSGPLTGEMTHVDDGLVKAVSSDIDQQNFIVTAVFQNPYVANTTGWDYGFTFRRTDSGEQMWLVVDSAAAWNLVDRRAGDDTFLSEGTLSDFDTQADGMNQITLIAVDEHGYLLVNDTFVSALNLSSRVEAGNISAITAFFTGNEQEGSATGYADFTVWALP